MKKIKVEADLTSFESELNRVRQSVAKINSALQGGASVSSSAAAKELDALVKRADKLTATIEKLNKAGAINSKQAGDAAKHFDTMARAAARLERHADVKEAWASSWLRESASEQRIRQQLIRNQPAQPGSGFNNKLISGASTIAGSLIGGGSIGSSFGALAGGRVGSVAGPVGAMIGAAIGGALGGRASSGLSDAKQTAIMFSETRYSLGALTTDFGTLRDSVQDLVGGLGIAHGEAANLAKQFVKTANVTSEQFGDIGESLKTSVGFGRGYGLDAGQSAGFFGTMRQFGVTKNDTDNRRLALMIGESVARSGNTAKMAEVLSSVGNYVSIATRRSLSDVNAGGYLSILNSMTGTGIAGLKNDPSNAASIIGQADQAFRQGGALGEGSRNFLLHALSKSNPNLTPMDLDLLLEQGLFGSGNKAFGRDSAAYIAADAYGDERYKKHLDSISTSGVNLMDMMRVLEDESGGSAEMMMKSLKGVLGMTDGGAAAFYTAYKNDPGMGNLQKILSGAGIGPEGLNAKAIGSLAEIAGASPEKLDQIWMGLMRKAPDKDVKAVESVLSEHGAGSEQFRYAILRLSNKIDNTDPGDLSRKLQADLNNSIQGLTENFVGVGKELIGAMTGLTNTLKPLVDWLAGGFGFADELIGDTKTKVSEGIGSLNKKIGQSASSGGPASGDTGGIGARLMRDLMREKKLSKIHAAAMVGNFMHETDGFKSLQEKNPINGGAGGFGFAHWTGPRRKQLEAWAAQKGLPVDSYEANKGFLYHEIEGPEKSAFQQLLKTNSLQEATMVFSDKFERPDKRYKRMDSRIRYAHAALRLAGDEMPAEQRRKESDKGMSFNANFNGEFRLRDMTGSEIADPLLLTWNHSPKPAGAN